MDDYEKGLIEVVHHLLGKDYYIADPVSGQDAAKIMVEDIKAAYSGRDEDPVDAWRRKHKKCLFCVHCEPLTPFDLAVECCPSRKWCKAKQTSVRFDMYRPWCRIFKLKKENKP